MSDSDSDDDKNIIKYKAKNLDKLSVTTSTIAYDSDFRMCYTELSNNIKKDNDRILAIKSTCLPLEECLEGGSFTKAARILKRREKNKQKRGSNLNRPSRTLSGNQLYFQSSVEFVHSYHMPNVCKYTLILHTMKKLNISMDLIKEITKYSVDAWMPRSYHNVRISPARGSIQIQGVKEPVYETAKYQIRDTLKYINKAINKNYDYRLFNRRIIIINTKCALNLINKEKYHIRVDKMSILMNELMEKQKNNQPLPLYIPYRIIFITNTYEAGSYIRIKFITPIDQNDNRKTTVKIFSGCKINFLGAPTLECPYYIYKFLDKFIEIYKDQIIYFKTKQLDLSLNNYINNLYKNEYAWVKLIKEDL